MFEGINERGNENRVEKYEKWNSRRLKRKQIISDKKRQILDLLPHITAHTLAYIKNRYNNSRRYKINRGKQSGSSEEL